jgi:hypothetical protein
MGIFLFLKNMIQGEGFGVIHLNELQRRDLGVLLFDVYQPSRVLNAHIKT